MAFENTVFIVDDDTASAASLQALMMMEGIDAEIYSSAEEFLDVYDGSGNGCLVLDIRLGGMSGLDLQEALSTAGASLPVIIISGNAEEAVRNETKSNGAIALLEKPFVGSELCDLVRDAISQRDPSRSR